MLNGTSQIIITKADVLNDFEEIKVCTHYQTGKETTTELPFDLCLTEAKPVYKSMPGWKRGIDKFVSFDEMPNELQGYVEFLEDYLTIPVAIISSGPQRNQLIQKK